MNPLFRRKDAAGGQRGGKPARPESACVAGADAGAVQRHRKISQKLFEEIRSFGPNAKAVLKPPVARKPEVAPERGDNKAASPVRVNGRKMLRRASKDDLCIGLRNKEGRDNVSPPLFPTAEPKESGERRTSFPRKHNVRRQRGPARDDSYVEIPQQRQKLVPSMSMPLMEENEETKPRSNSSIAVAPSNLDSYIRLRREQGDKITEVSSTPEKNRRYQVCPTERHLIKKPASPKHQNEPVMPKHQSEVTSPKQQSEVTSPKQQSEVTSPKPKKPPPVVHPYSISANTPAALLEAKDVMAGDYSYVDINKIRYTSPAKRMSFQPGTLDSEYSGETSDGYEMSPPLMGSAPRSKSAGAMMFSQPHIASPTTPPSAGTSSKDTSDDGAAYTSLLASTKKMPSTYQKAGELARLDSSSTYASLLASTTDESSVYLRLGDVPEGTEAFTYISLIQTTANQPSPYQTLQSL